jgi:ElaB/YqjD/DUF883 family membrane-anchored ribosome-binding protein
MRFNKQNNFSSFWLGDTFENKSLIENEQEKPKVDYIKLASYQRAISNFVNIVTAKNIPVKFSKRGDSYTDGEVVTISSKLDDKLFDSSVGLALHEGSHILLSDFAFLKTLGSTIPKTFYKLANSKGLTNMEAKTLVKHMLNYVEDRRIDNYVITTSPGYKGYYLSMYDKYFHSPTVDKGLKSADEMREKNLDSYLFRIINFTNVNTDLDALPGLRDIWNKIDLRNISRLTTTGKAYQVAYDMSKIILNNLDTINSDDKFNEIKKKLNQGLKEAQDNDDDDMVNDFAAERIKQFIDKFSENMSYEDLLNSVEVEAGYLGDNGKLEKQIQDMKQSLFSGLSDAQKSELRKKIERVLEKQKKFLEGKITKRKLSKKDIQQVEAVSESGTTYKDVLNDNKHKHLKSGRYKATGDSKVIVVKNLTKSLIDSDMFPNLLANNRWNQDDKQDIVLEGLRLGKMLGKKLQIRGEQRLLKNTRLKSGRIDKRLVAELGFNNESVFHNIDIEKYPDGFLHISLDASGSMYGKSFNNSLTCAISIIQAVDMIQNFDVVFTLRGTSSKYSGGADVPVILYAYDSRVDKISKVRKLFKYLSCGSTTPEGLCYEAIMEEMIYTTDKVDSYFLNFSDGMPMYSNDEMYYSGEEARIHTRDMVNKMRKMGINVLSYFISKYERDDDFDYMRDFKQMYGSDAEKINILSIPQVAKTMNNLFLRKK